MCNHIINIWIWLYNCTRILKWLRPHYRGLAGRDFCTDLCHDLCGDFAERGSAWGSSKKRKLPRFKHFQQLFLLQKSLSAAMPDFFPDSLVFCKVWKSCPERWWGCWNRWTHSHHSFPSLSTSMSRVSRSFWTSIWAVQKPKCHSVLLVKFIEYRKPSIFQEISGVPVNFPLNQ